MNPMPTSTNRAVLIAVAVHVAIVGAAVVAATKLSGENPNAPTNLVRYAFLALSMVFLARFIVAFRAGRPASERTRHALSAVGALLLSQGTGGSEPLGLLGLMVMLAGIVGMSRQRAKQAE
jgi:hypothetical protein